MGINNETENFSKIQASQNPDTWLRDELDSILARTDAIVDLIGISPYVDNGNAIGPGTIPHAANAARIGLEDARKAIELWWAHKQNERDQ